jgi:SPP1 family phage portal protein
MYTGRTKILCDETEITAENVVALLTDALLTHQNNSAQIDYLYQYYRGNQPILSRTKTIRPEICNKIVENRANEIVSFKTGYLCGEPLQYVSRGSTDDISDGISKLNDMMLLCGKAAKDKELAEWMYICGTGYRMITPNSPYINSDIVPKLQNRRTDFMEDEAPFDIYTLDPRNAFVVYHSGLGEQPLIGVKFVEQKDKTIIYSAYTPTQYFEIVSDNLIGGLRVKKTEDRPLRAIPIVEYPLNNARQGAFEVVLPLLDALNEVQSNRLDGIAQFIQSLIVLTNADIDDDAAKAIREAGLIKLKSFSENKASIDIIAEQLDQQQTQVLVDYLHQTILDIVGMPNRNGGSSTSDTGAAVFQRDGHSSAESRAKSDELMFKEAERNVLKIALSIIRSTVGTTLKLSDVETKFTRRNYENSLSKSQILTSMLANDKIAPALAFAHCGLFSDPEDAAKMSAEHYERVKGEQAAQTTPDEPPKDGDAVA